MYTRAIHFCLFISILCVYGCVCMFRDQYFHNQKQMIQTLINSFVSLSGYFYTKCLAKREVWKYFGENVKTHLTNLELE